MERYLAETVTSRRIPFTLEGIEKLKDLRQLISPDKENPLPYPTVINEMIISLHGKLVQEGSLEERDITKGE
jgi:hypothetical protein